MLMSSLRASKMMLRARSLSLGREGWVPSTSVMESGVVLVSRERVNKSWKDK